MLMRSSDRQLENALFPISVTESGISTLVRAVQQENALSPMTVTDFGIAIWASASQYLNASAPISTTESGITKVSVVFGTHKRIFRSFEPYLRQCP